jgi:rare lipoprotein A
VAKCLRCSIERSDGNVEASEKLLIWAGPASETMIRPIFVAMALACTSTSAFAEKCIASHYGYSGGRTASGERMNPSAMTAAHRTRPFGSEVTVTSHSSGRSVTVRVNDRGPFVKGRCIDVSSGAAGALGMAGLETVSLR